MRHPNGLVILGFLLAACGGQIDASGPAAGTGTSESGEPAQAGDPNAPAISNGDFSSVIKPSTVSEESAPGWWHNAIFSSIWYSFCNSAACHWDDTDIWATPWTPIQLRNSSRLIGYGVYGWGYMPTFVDLRTGQTFRFLHLHPGGANERATAIGRVYPAGYIVGYSGGNTWDTGLGSYSTGAHLCVQTHSWFRTAFPW